MAPMELRHQRHVAEAQKMPSEARREFGCFPAHVSTGMISWIFQKSPKCQKSRIVYSSGRVESNRVNESFRN